jgi:hypothetical protein
MHRQPHIVRDPLIPLALPRFNWGCDDLTIQRILRPNKVSGTREHYIRLRDPKVEDAMSQLSEALRKSDMQQAGRDQ